MTAPCKLGFALLGAVAQCDEHFVETGGIARELHVAIGDANALKRHLGIGEAAQPPRIQYGNTNVPLAWISEAACSITESGPGDIRLARTFAVIAAQLAWVWTTALSAPVVPEV